MTRRPVPARLLLLALAGCGGAADPAVRGLDGATHRPLAVAEGQVHVCVFTSSECPIANAYAPTLRELAALWRADPVRLFVVHVEPDLDAAQATTHATAYELPGTVLLDPHHVLASALRVRRTPEAVVVTSTGVAYQGRIDDQWAALGSRAASPHVHDLRDAVAAVLAGKPVATPATEAVGCLLPEPKR